MIRILSFLVFIVLQSVNAQDCIPEPVKNVTLGLDYMLRWLPSTNCANTVYMIYIRISEEDLQYIYTTSDVQLNVEQLPACERFYFEVSAIVGNDLSEPALLVAYVPAPSGADLTIDSFDATVQDEATFLNWHVTDKFAHCARSFRLVIHDSVTQIPRDVYTERNNIFLRDLVPCGRYEFGIMAIYNLQSEGPINLLDYVAPQEVAPLPVLESVNAGSTYVNISWSLPSYSVNRCTITELDVNGLPFLHQHFPVHDTPERPLFTTSLDSLRPESMYILRVSIVNSAGSSQPNTIGVQTLPAGSD